VPVTDRRTCPSIMTPACRITRRPFDVRVNLLAVQLDAVDAELPELVRGVGQDRGGSNISRATPLPR
jgi:hypothetical protein